jgi:hypothetical protein
MDDQNRGQYQRLDESPRDPRSSRRGGGGGGGGNRNLDVRGPSPNAMVDSNNINSLRRRVGAEAGGSMAQRQMSGRLAVASKEAMKAKPKLKPKNIIAHPQVISTRRVSHFRS